MTIIWADSGDNDSSMLKKIWENASNITLVHITEWNDVVEKFVNLAISNEQDTLLFCGHGSSYGLFAPNSLCEYILHQENVRQIKAKNIIGVSCYAKEFAKRNNLHGFFTDMFISNINEAVDYGVCATIEDIYESANIIFSIINKILTGQLSYHDCLEMLKTTDTDNPVFDFNVNGIEIL